MNSESSSMMSGVEHLALGQSNTIDGSLSPKKILRSSGTTSSKKTQQIFHPSLFATRQRSNSLTEPTSKVCNTATVPIMLNIGTSKTNSAKTASDSQSSEINEGDNCTNSNQATVSERKSPDTENWTTLNERKRPRSSPGHKNEQAQKQTKLNTYWLSQPIPISNRFDELSVETEQENSKPIGEKVPKPPPIFVDKVENLRPLQQLLDEHGPTNYEIKVLNDNRIKIQTKTPDTYKEIIKQLERKNTEFYTYRPKQERSFKVVLKNIHSSTDTEDIQLALKEMGHDALNIWNMKQRVTKKALHMFIVELAPKSNNKQIYDVKSLLNCRIKIEPPRPARNIPQCANCQQYGHTKSYCRRSPKCIKCAGNHLSSDCNRKERSDSVKCVLCGGNHPANYKGCQVYKELQKQKYPPLRNKIIIDQPNHENNGKSSITCNKTDQQNKKSYADTLKPNNNAAISLSSENPDQSNDMKQLLEMFKQIMNQMCTMTNLLTNLMSIMSKNSTN